MEISQGPKWILIIACFVHQRVKTPTKKQQIFAFEEKEPLNFWPFLPKNLLND